MLPDCFGRSVANRYTSFAEDGNMRSEDRYEPQHIDSLPSEVRQAVARLTATQQLDFHVAAGLNHNAPSYIVGVGYSFRVDGLFR